MLIFKISFKKKWRAFTLQLILGLFFCCLIPVNLRAQSPTKKSISFNQNPKLAPTLLKKYTGKTLHTYRLYLTNPNAFRAWSQKHLPAIRLVPNSQIPNIITAVNVSERDLQQLLACSWVTFIDVPNRKAKTERALPHLDLTANHVATVHQTLPDLNGLGLTVSIKEKPFDTTDIDFKGRILKNQVFNQAASNHATDMATIIGGGGNSAPAGKGIAWGAQLTAADFAELMPDNIEELQNSNVTVQNHAYGVAIENYYGLEAVAYDQLTTQYPELIHVFSSGNEGNNTSETGTYATMKGWANLTGQFKMSKNTLSVGATDTAGQVSLLSSRGPAHDGRLKPELVAFGAGGTSEAAAVVSGIALLVQQAYQRQTNNSLPPASLIKAALVNSADDKGRTGIDFETGFGQADALGAVQTMREKRFFMGTALPGKTQQYLIQVPPGTQQLKVTLVWHEPAALPNANKALINDLDLTLRHLPSGQEWHPWVLNTYPHPDSLQQLPQRKPDQLNNIEQVTLTLPAAGQYALQVNGHQITSANQDFSLTYEFTTGINWRYPAAGSYLAPGQVTRLRWEGSSSFAAGQLEYRLGNNPEWQLISDAVDLQKGFFNWTIPDVTGTGQLRLKVGSEVIISDTFMIMPDLILQVGYNCNSDFMLHWPALPATQEYQVYQLGKNYLEPYLRTADTMLIINKSQPLSDYYAIAPVIQGNTGPRSYTFNSNQNQTGCYIQSFLPRQVVTDSVIFDATLSTLYDLTHINLQRLENGQYKTIQTTTPVNKLDFIFNDLTPQPGRNEYRLAVMSNTKGMLYSQPETVFYTPANFIQVYPNPIAKGQLLNIVLASDAPTDLLVYDSVGRLVATHNELGEIKTIATAHLKPGLYFIRAKTQTGKYIISRFIII